MRKNPVGTSLTPPSKKSAKHGFYVNLIMFRYAFSPLLDAAEDEDEEEEEPMMNDAFGKKSRVINSGSNLS